MKITTINEAIKAVKKARMEWQEVDKVFIGLGKVLVALKATKEKALEEKRKGKSRSKQS
jgi:hypothetical protein